MDHKPVLLANLNHPEVLSLRGYEAAGGYKTLRKVLKEQSPRQVLDLIRKSGLRGRGGAGFPTGLKWSFLPEDHPGPVYFCVNADESEPGTFVNRIEMETDPHQVLEGIILSCYATRASTAYIYLRYEYPLCLARMQRAIDEAREAGYIGRSILGTPFSLEVTIHRGAAAYVCGEETALIESLEGKRAWPRIKPPFPAVEGLFRKPTVVNNVETVACVKHILERGVEWFKSMGVPPDPDNPRDPGSYGPKLFGVSGHVNRPGVYELPLGIPARELIERHAGGVWKGRKVKAVVPGGLSTGVMTADELDTRMDFSAPLKVGCLGLGTGCMIVLDDHYSMVDFLYNSCRFFSHESCGQCTPCREGTHWSVQMLERIKAGQGRLKDLDLLLEIGDSIGIIPGTTICGLADGAAWPIKTAIRKFRDEFESYIKRTNPRGYQTTRPVPALHVYQPDGATPPRGNGESASELLPVVSPTAAVVNVDSTP
ncbi:MAG: NADH-quinone oxidoreductase subunit NuoF [Planctomycetota bacterium]